VLYRWQFDKWQIENLGGVHDDWKMAMDHEYVWLPPDRVRFINGHEVRGSFLDFYEAVGESFCGPPLTEAAIENGIRTQFFARLVLQQDLSGRVALLPVGAELLALRRENARLEELNTRLLEQVGLATLNHPTPPQWQDVVSELPQHPTKRYERRKTSDVRYLVISHSAIPGTVHPATIARFHVDHVQWPGIGYHFYIGDRGQIYKTNELTTISHHVGPQDAVSIGICVGGNFSEQTPTTPQIESTAHLTAWLLHELELPLDAIRGKNEFVEADSPGHQWLSGAKWKSTLTERVSTLLNLWDQDI
jgi:hypothetical protein